MYMCGCVCQIAGWDFRLECWSCPVSEQGKFWSQRASGNQFRAADPSLLQRRTAGCVTYPSHWFGPSWCRRLPWTHCTHSGHSKTSLLFKFSFFWFASSLFFCLSGKSCTDVRYRALVTISMTRMNRKRFFFCLMYFLSDCCCCFFKM